MIVRTLIWQVSHPRRDSASEASSQQPAAHSGAPLAAACSPAASQRSLPAYPGTWSFCPRLDGGNGQELGSVSSSATYRARGGARRRASMRKGRGGNPVPHLTAL